MIVKCAFGVLKQRFKILQGVTDRKNHKANARMITAAAVLHNLLIDVGDGIRFRNGQDHLPGNMATVFNDKVNITTAERELAEAKRNTYMNRFNDHDRG